MRATLSVAGETKSARLDLRLTSEVKEMVEQAAQIRGVGVTAFVSSVLYEASQAEIEKAASTRLSDRDRDLFLAMLDIPKPPNEALLNAFERYKKEVATP